MLSMSRNGASEVFGHSLQQPTSYPDSEMAPKPADLATHPRLRAGSSEKETTSASYAAPGTTFPPRSCAHFDLLKAKYHSETDLGRANARAASWLTQAHMLKELLLKEEEEKGAAETAGGSLSDVDDEEEEFSDHEEEENMKYNEDFDLDEHLMKPSENDSDLFFDFDIDSPNENNASADNKSHGSRAQLLHKLPSVPSEPQQSEEMPPKRRNSADSFFSAGGDSSSTAFGSMSSFGGEMSLKPEDWAAKQQSDDDETIVISNDDDEEEGEINRSGQTEEETNTLSPTSSSSSNTTPVASRSPDPGSLEDTGSDDEDGSDFQVTTAHDDKTHHVAKSKLNALIALLEKDASASSASPLSRSNSAGDNSSEAAAPSRGNPMRKKSFQTSLPTISASPANFSFLSGGGIPAFSPKSEAVPEESREPREPQMDTLRVGEEPATTEKKARMRRASSLKSGKTPPGTPNRKNVRFADVLGLDLTLIKTFRDEVPRVPKSAYHDLTDIELSDQDSDAGSTASSSSNNRGAAAARKFMQFNNSRFTGPAAPPATQQTTLVPMFNQPGGFPNFFDLLRERKVCLENAYTCDPRSVQGTVRVQNLSFHKRVTVRFTVNEWASYGETAATYVDGSCDGFSDRFTFAVSLGAAMGVGGKLQMCVRFECDGGREYWDSNDGKNYVFQSLRATSASPASMAGPKASAPMQAVYGAHAHAQQPYSHSPSAMMGDDPWLRYL